MSELNSKALTNNSIDKISVFVSNYKSALAFYKGLLKLPVVWEGEESRNAGFRVGANLLIIQEDRSQVKPGGIRLYFTVSNIEILSEELVKDKIACTEIKNYGDFKLVDFTDEDGNRLGLMEPLEHYIPVVEEYLGRKISLRNNEG
jgi:hypothetical protein